jgi:plastocyanin
MTKMRATTASLALAAVGALAASVAQAETLTVAINAATYIPAEITAKVGDTIIWSNQDIFVHSVTDRGKSFDMNILPKHDARITLRNIGGFSYYCRFHPNMQGRLTVNP